MTAAAPLALPDTAPRPRTRLIALALAGWHDHVRITVSTVRGESGSGEQTTMSGRTSTRRRDELLLRLQVGSGDGRPTSMDAYRHARRPGDLERGSHPFWAELERAMTLLEQRDKFGHDLVVRTLVADPLPGADWRRVVAAIHALPYIAGGVSYAVCAPRYALVAALRELDEILPANIVFPREVGDQVEGWNVWLASVKGAASAKQQRSRSYQAACSLRDAHILELSNLAGWSQARIAVELGVHQSTVSRALKRTEAAA
jgi:hypothetical protein